MSYMSQNYCLFHVSNLSVRNFRICSAHVSEVTGSCTPLATSPSIPPVGHSGGVVAEPGRRAGGGGGRWIDPRHLPGPESCPRGDVPSRRPGAGGGPGRGCGTCGVHHGCTPNSNSTATGGGSPAIPAKQNKITAGSFVFIILILSCWREIDSTPACITFNLVALA